MVNTKKRRVDNSHFGKEHRRLIMLGRQRNKRDSLIQVGKLRRKFPRRGKPHWVGDYKNYPVSNAYWDRGICPPRMMDKDGDRVVDWEDCNPRNPYQQGIIRNIINKVTGKNKQSNPSLGTIFLKPSESSQASTIAKQSGATVQVVGGSTSNPVVLSTTTSSGGRTTTVAGSGGGSNSLLQSGSVQSYLNEQAEEVRRLEDAKRQADAEKKAEESRNLQYAINQAKSNKIKIEQEADLRKQISGYQQKLKDSQTKAEYDRLLAEKKSKERELSMSQSGVTSYNKKIALETYTAQQEYNSYLNNELKKLQAEVDAGNINVETANKLLQQRAESKADQVNKNLNSKISNIEVPNALKVPINTVEAVEPPKGLLNKGINKLQNIPMSKTSNDNALKNQVSGLKELGIGVALGGLSFVKGIVDLPKTIVALVKNPSLIKNIPGSVKQSGAELGESLRISPTRTLARVGTELFLMTKGGEIVKRVTGAEKTKLLTKLDEAGTLSRIELKIIRTGKIPKITLRIRTVEEALKPIASTKNIRTVAKDISKLVPKTVPKLTVTKLTKLSEDLVRAFLRDKRVLKELRLKYPNKIRFTLQEIKNIKSYAKLKTAIKRDVFAKYGVKAVRQTRKAIKTGGRRIGGVKVPRKEFKSFQEANIEFQKLKRLGKFVKKIESKGGVGRIERLPKRPINAKELEYFKVGSKIPRQILKDVKQVEVTTFTQKFSARIPVLKRYGDLKKGYWRTIIQDREFYQNSVSFSLYKKGGKSIGTITFNTLSAKPITRFRSLTNALKWGTNKEVVLSKLVGKNFVRSFVLSARGRRITANEFLSKIKVKANGEFQDVFIATKKIPVSTSRGNLKKQFREAIPVSATKGKIQKFTQQGLIKFNKKRGYMEIVQRGKVVKLIRTKSIINPVIIDTSKIDRVVRELESLKNKAFSQARIKRLREYKKLINSAERSRPFMLNGKQKVFISESKLKQINRIAKETTTLKESLAGKSIPPRLKVTRRVEGVKQLRKLKQAEQSLKKLRVKLLKRNALDVGLKTAISQSLILANRLKQNLKNNQILVTDQKTQQIQKSIQRSLQQSKSKLGLKSINTLRLEFPILSIPPMPRSIRSRVPRAKSPKLRLPSNNKDELLFKTFSKPVQIFSIVVKKRGKNIILKDRLIERDALNYMSYELDNQLLRSARLKPLGTSRRARIIPPKYNGAFEMRKRKLRQYKIKGKKKVAIRGFIEKQRFALDTPGERMQLRAIQRRSKFRRPVRQKRKISPSQRRELLERLKKARRVRQRNLKARSSKRRK